MKRYWGAAAAAIVTRAYQLDLIDAAQASRAFAYMRKKRWHKGEPFESNPEQPELIQTAFEALEQETGETSWDVAQSLDWLPQTMEEVSGISAPPRRMDSEIVEFREIR